MEDGVGSILYIIITVIVILVGVLRKKKKPQQVPGVPGEEGESGVMDFLDKLGLKDTDESREEFYDIDREETTEQADKKQHEISITPTFKDQPGDKTEGQKKVDKEESKEIDAYEIPDEYDEAMDEIKEEFDLKKAIVYSEIINKKYE